MDKERIAEIASRYKNNSGKLLGIFEDIQQEERYLSEATLFNVSEVLNVSLSQAYGVATFYSFFNLKPVGKHIITVCMGTACHVRGAVRILKSLEKLLGVEPGETTDDGKFMLTTKDKEFTVNTARCFGACNMAPVVRIDGKIYGYNTPEKLPSILKKYGWSEK